MIFARKRTELCWWTLSGHKIVSEPTKIWPCKASSEPESTRCFTHHFSKTRRHDWEIGWSFPSLRDAIWQTNIIDFLDKIHPRTSTRSFSNSFDDSPSYKLRSIRTEKSGREWGSMILDEQIIKFSRIDIHRFSFFICPCLQLKQFARRVLYSICLPRGMDPTSSLHSNA
jgi:hypothetical protein